MSSARSPPPRMPLTLAADIPFDVLEYIFDCAQLSDLASLCRTSKGLYPHARDALYRHLNLTPRTVLNAFSALCRDPSLAPRVNTLILAGENFEMAFGIIQDMLLLMPQLRTLVLMIGSYGSWVLPQNDTSPFQLHTLKCNLKYDKELHNFLTGQRRLRRLLLPSPSLDLSLIKFTPDHLPYLTFLAAPWPVVYRVVPNRPVQQVTIYPNRERDRKNNSILDFLSESTVEKGVQRLITSRENLYAVGTRLAEKAPGLTHLTSDSTLIDPSQDASVLFPDWMEEIVSHLQCLRIFAIKLEPDISPIPCQEIDFSPFVTKVFEASSSLDYVLIAFNRLQAKYTCKRIPGEEWYICDDFEAF